MIPGRPREPARIKLLPVLVALWAASACATIGGGAGTAVEWGGPSSSRSPGGRLRAVYKGTVVQGGKKRSFRQILALDPPDRARLELLGPLGHPRLILAFDGRGALGLYPREKVYFREESQETAFTALLGVPLTTRDLFPLMTGEIFFREADTRVADPLPEGDGWKVVAWQPRSGLRYVLHLGGRARRVRRVELFRGDPELQPALLSVEYPGKPRRNPGSIPAAWDLHVPGADFRLSVNLVKSTRTAEAFPDGLFHPPVPPGFRRVAAREIAPDRPLLAEP